MSLQSLQQALDLSLERATPFAKSLFEGNTWTADEVQDFANAVGSITLATIDAQGRPHAAPLIGGCMDGTLLCSVSVDSAVLRHVRKDPNIAFTITGESHSVMGTGTARVRGHTSELPEVGEALDADSKLGQLFHDTWDGFVYEIEVRRIFAS